MLFAGGRAHTHPVDGDLFPTLERRGWSLANRSALAFFPPTVLIGAVAGLGVHWLAPSLPAVVPWLIFTAVGMVGANAQHRFIARHDHDRDSGLGALGGALEDGDDSGRSQ